MCTWRASKAGIASRKQCIGVVIESGAAVNSLTRQHVTVASAVRAAGAGFLLRWVVALFPHADAGPSAKHLSPSPRPLTSSPSIDSSPPATRRDFRLSPPPVLLDAHSIFSTPRPSPRTALPPTSARALVAHRTTLLRDCPFWKHPRASPSSHTSTFIHLPPADHPPSPYFNAYRPRPSLGRNWRGLTRDLSWGSALGGGIEPGSYPLKHNPPWQLYSNPACSSRATMLPCLRLTAYCLLA